MTTRRLIVFSIWFQLIWFLAILGKEQWQWVILVLVVGTIALSARLAALKIDRLLLLLVIGVFIDYLNLKVGLFHFQQDFFPLWLGGLWGIFLWYAFYLTPILIRYPLWLVSMLSGTAGALSYYAGMELNAVSFPIEMPLTLLVLFTEWVVIINVVLRVYHYDRNESSNHKGAPS